VIFDQAYNSVTPFQVVKTVKRFTKFPGAGGVSSDISRHLRAPTNKINQTMPNDVQISFVG
jgi:hypothetical protein